MALVAAATLFGILGTSSAAHAAACSGVTVVVDFHQLGGVQQTCDAAGGGKAASDIFVESGFALEYSQQQPGAVCRVDGQPSNQQCVAMPPANAYWALYWSDGSDGTWTYASVGVRSLKVPAGASVAFSWSQGGTAQPSVTAPVTAAPSSPAAPSASGTKAATAAPTRTASSRPKPGATHAATASPTTSSMPRVSTSPSTKPTKRASVSPSTGQTAGASASSSGPAVAATETPSAAPSPSATTGPMTATDAPTANSGGLPGWVPVALVGVLLLVAGVVVAVRRRS